MSFEPTIGALFLLGFFGLEIPQFGREPHPVDRRNIV
jgi:hypothetical protein